MRFPTVLLLVLLAIPAHAQQGAAGYGQGGGFGGGMGGGFGGAGGRFGEISDEDRQTHPEDDGGDDGRLWETRTAILTPDDRVEYKIKAEKGGTLFAGATSDAFDPALSVVDEKGREIAKNDDREEGDQAPFVAVRLAEAGTVTLKVLSYKQAAGGKFTLKLRTFASQDAPLGRSTHDFASGPEDNRRVDLRIVAKKGVVYDLRETPSLGPNVGPVRFVRLIGPNGVERADFDRVAAPDGGPVFQPRISGDYYVEYRTYGPARFAVDLREVPIVPMTADAERTADLNPGDLVVFEFPVKSQEVVRTTIVGTATAYRMVAPTDPRRTTGSSDPAYGYDPAWTWFKLDRNSDKDVVRIFRAEGTARMAVRSTGTTPQKVTLRNSRSLPRWKEGETEKGILDIGESRLFLLDSTNSELMRVSAASPTFKPRLDIFRLNGDLANTLPAATKHEAADDLYFPKADTFLVRLSCDGYGGSGDYALRRDTPQAVPYVLGAAGRIALDGTNFGLYAVDLIAGQRYQLTIDRSDVPLRVDLLHEDGTFLTSQRVAFEGVEVQYFVPTRSGRHRLWLRGGAGERRFRFEVHTPPTVGP